MSTILPMDGPDAADEKAAYAKEDADIESGSHSPSPSLQHGHIHGHGGIAIAVKEAEIEPDKVYIRRFGPRYGPWLERLFASGVEARGVERVPEDQRETKNVWNNLLMWFSVNTVLTTIPIGVLGQSIFTLTLPHAIATIFCFGALGGLMTAFIATLGPKTGLRTMIITRYSAGYLGGTLFSLLNILTQLGFATTAVILGGQTLSSIHPGSGSGGGHELPLVVGIIIVGVCSLVPCFVGYELVHVYERYAWMVMVVVMLFLYGLGGAKGYDINAQKEFEDTGKDLTADILSFGGIVFGSFTGWAPIAADYNNRLPSTTSSTRVFTLTFLGLFIPIVFVECLGAALVTISDPAYVSAFDGGNTGALIAQVLSPWGGFGKFVLVLLGLSVVANNIPNTYSCGIAMQALGRPFALLPRFLYTLLAFVIYTVAGVAGREHFSAILSNFLAILGYWTAFFIVIVAEEHFVFRGGRRWWGVGLEGGYDLEVYDDFGKLPLGIAGVLAGCFGVAGAVVGMAEVWYIGPIAAKLGPFGGDLGFELAGAFAGVTYPVFRWLEIKYTGR